MGSGGFSGLNIQCLGGLAFFYFCAKMGFCRLSSLIETYSGTHISDTFVC